MYNIDHTISDFDNIGQLRQIASRFCPEELQSVARTVVPDEVDGLNLADLEAGFLSLLQGGSGRRGWQGTV